MSENPLPKKRAKISAFVIAKNEEREIAECLESVSFCDEVLVIDSFSEDRTVEIAESCGARVIQREWPGYKDQKAFGLANTTHEWVVNLDADERVSDELREEILALLASEPALKEEVSSNDIVGYWVNRVVFYLGRWWRQGGWYPEWRLRVFRKSSITWGGVDPHEKPIARGQTSRFNGELKHYTYRSMDEQFQRLHQHSTLAAKQEFHQGKTVSVFRLLFNPLLRMFKFYVVKRGYREGKAGLIVAIAEGFYTFMKYAKIWEIQQGYHPLEKPNPPKKLGPLEKTGANAQQDSNSRKDQHGSDSSGDSSSAPRRRYAGEPPQDA